MDRNDLGRSQDVNDQIDDIAIAGHISAQANARECPHLIVAQYLQITEGVQERMRDSTSQIDVVPNSMNSPRTFGRVGYGYAGDQCQALRHRSCSSPTPVLRRRSPNAFRIRSRVRC
ncbi:DUF1931 family protein [Mycobacterium sp. Marseille-P9652]|uniref:DUF1931 family protein n=1 Tax=Mycobacterium sp. Marseille-P9652 TaxID=2654950 RepID=UPI0012E97881